MIIEKDGKFHVQVPPGIWLKHIYKFLSDLGYKRNSDNSYYYRIIYDDQPAVIVDTEEDAIKVNSKFGLHPI